jgi:hypothetical protein
MYSTRYSSHVVVKLEYSRLINLANLLIPNFMKTRPVGAKMFRAGEGADRQRDRRIDMTKLIHSFI